MTGGTFTGEPPEKLPVVVDTLTEDFIPPVLDVVLKVRLDKRPKAVYQQPDGKKLKFRWNDGCCEFTVPRVDIHSTVVFE